MVLAVRNPARSIICKLSLPCCQKKCSKRCKALVDDMLSGLAHWIRDAKASGEIHAHCDDRQQAAILLAVCEHGSQLQRVLDGVLTADLVAEWYQGLSTPSK